MKTFIQKLSQNILVVILVLGILVTINFLSGHFSKRWDLTEDQEYTFSEATQKVIDRLEDRLTIKLYYSDDLPPVLQPIQERVSDLLNEIKAHSKQTVIVENVSPDANEDKERETLSLGIQPLQLNIVEKDKREVKKVYMGMVLYYRDQSQVIPVVAQVQNLEYQLGMNILKMTEKELPKIGLLIGSNEQRYQLVQQLIEQIGHLVLIDPTTKNLSEKKLAALLIVQPDSLDKGFVKQLDALLSEGTHVLLFMGNVAVSENMTPEPMSTGMDDWLSEKGVGVSDKLLLDPRQNEQAGFQAGMMQVYLPYPFWVKALNQDLNAESPVTAQLEEVLFPWTNVIEVHQDQDLSWQATELIHSSEQSFLQIEDTPDVNPQYIQQMTKLPAMQSYPLFVQLNDKSDDKIGKVFLSSNSHMLQDQFLQQVVSNAVFFENLLEYTSWGNHLIGIRSRGKTARPLAQISDTAKTVIKWGHMVVIPIFSVLMGLIILYILKKRRQKLIMQIQ